MNQVCWGAASTGGYWMDVIVGNQILTAMIDLGLVDPQGHVGFEIEPATYDTLDQSGQLSSFRRRQHRTATGQQTVTMSGLAKAQMIEPVSGKAIGPITDVYVSRGILGLPSRVGVVFFHRLIGCRVLWELSSRTWCVEYP